MKNKQKTRTHTAKVKTLILVTITLLFHQPAFCAANKNLTTPQQLKKQIVGPVMAIPTPFKPDLQIHYEGVRTMVERALNHGCRVFSLTRGNSRYNQLTYEEAKKLTKCLVDIVGDRGIAMAATGEWWEEMDKIIAYVKYAESIKADAVQVLRPPPFDKENKDDPANDSHVMEFYRKVADSTKLGIVLHGYFPLRLLGKLTEIESIVAMKADGNLRYFIDVQMNFGDRFAIFPGASDARLLAAYPYGCRASYSGLYTFVPDVARQYWQAVKEGNITKAGYIAQKYDYGAFLKDWTHPRWHALLELYGVAYRNVRPPMQTYTDAQMAKLREFFVDQLGLEPKRYKGYKMTPGPELPRSRGGNIAGVVEGHVVTVGGTNWSSNRTQKFWLNEPLVLRNGKWQPGPEMPHPLACAMFDHDRTGLYVAGGTDGSKSKTYSQVYRLEKLDSPNPWQELTPLPEPISSGAGAILDGTFYVACGTSGDEMNNNLWALNTKKPQSHWKKCASLPGESRSFPAMTACGGYIYLLGGVTSWQPLVCLSDAYRYDPQKDQWQKLDELPFDGYCWVANPIDDNHLIVTGRADGKQIYRDVYVVDLTDMSVKKVSETIDPAATAPFIEVEENQWWTIGGEPDSNKTRTAKISQICYGFWDKNAQK